MISCYIYDIMYDIISFWQHHSHLPVSCAILFHIAYDFIYISYEICYDISMLWYYSWHHSIYAMIRPSDISMSWYHSHVNDVISRISGYVRLYHHDCTYAAGWRGLGPPGASCSTFSSLTIANVLGTVVQLNSDGPTALIPLMDLFSRCNFKFKVEKFSEISSWT